MRKPLTLCASAVLAAGLAFFGYDSSVLAADRDVQGADINARVTTEGGGADVKASANLPTGITKAERTDNSGIYDMLSKAVQATLNDNDLSDLTMYLSQNDRQRLGDVSKAKDDQFNQKLEQFKQAWQQKYNQQFSIDGQVAFGEQFQDFTIVQGEVENPTLLSNWPVEASQGSDMKLDTERKIDTEPRVEGDLDIDADVQARDDSRFKADAGGPGNPPFDVVPGQGNEQTPEADDADITAKGDAETDFGMKDEADVDIDAEADRTGEYGARGEMELDEQPLKASIRAEGHDLKKGSEVALVNFPQQSGLQPLTVSLIQDDANKWLIDIPNTLSADGVRTNLNTHLTYLLDHKDQWPADATQAQRLVSHHILAALYDVKHTGGAGMPGQMMPGHMGGQQPQR